MSFHPEMTSLLLTAVSIGFKKKKRSEKRKDMITPRDAEGEGLL